MGLTSAIMGQLETWVLRESAAGVAEASAGKRGLFWADLQPSEPPGQGQGI